MGRSANGGVLLSNLFSGWPPEQLISIYSDNRYPPDTNLISSHFKIQMGSNESFREMFRNFPLFASGKSESLDGFITFKPSERLEEWLDDQKPDIIYSHLGSITMSQVTLYCQKHLRIPVFNHIMDDYISSWPSRGFVKKLPLARRTLNKINSRIFSEALKAADINSAISVAMKHEYEARYGSNFEVYSNGISVRDELHRGHKMVEDSDRRRINKRRFRVLFMGSISENVNLHILKKLIDIINNWIDADIDLSIDILSRNADDFGIKSGKNTKVLDPVDQANVLSVMRSYDALLFPYNFDPETIRFIRLSMPTRLAEYAISGVPIISIGDKSVHFISDILKSNAAFTIVSEDESVIIKELKKFFNNFEKSKIYALNALEYASSNFDILKISEKFQQRIIDLVKNNEKID